MGCVSNCVLILVNIVTMLLGLAVIGLSSYVIHLTMNFSTLVLDGSILLLVPMWTLIGGVCLTVVALFGCCGTIKRSPCMLRLYGSLVLIFFGMELVCGVLLLINREYAAEVFEDRMRKSFAKYGQDNKPLTDSIDLAQHELKCCGIKTYEDWFYIRSTNSVTPGCCNSEMPGVDADTCYKNINELTPLQIEETIYTIGCFDAMKEKLADETMALGIMAIVLVVIQLGCIIFAFVTASQEANKQHRYGYYGSVQT